MTTTLNATTSNGLVVTPDNSGNVVLQYNGQSAPCFSAYSTAAQSFSSGTWTKVQYNNETFDTNSNYDSTTNYRFTPTVAGYYQINAIMTIDLGMNYAQIAIYKNGSAYKRLYTYETQGYSIQIADILYCNGSTDYVEIYINPVTTYTGGPNSQSSTFSGCLLRGA